MYNYLNITQVSVTLTVTDVFEKLTFLVKNEKRSYSYFCLFTRGEYKIEMEYPPDCLKTG